MFSLTLILGLVCFQGFVIPSALGQDNYPKCDITCPSRDGLFQNPQDCTTFCHCSNNIPYLERCPPTLVFNPYTLECDYPRNVPCDICNVAGCSGTGGPTTQAPTTQTPVTTPATTPTTPTTQSTATTTSTTTTRPTTQPAGFQCPSDNGGNGFYPIPGECGSNFYDCVGGVPTLTVCPNGAIFDPNTFVCVLPNVATCNANYRCPLTDGFYPIEGQCTPYYYICSDRELTGYGKCPGAPGQFVFDPIERKCVAASTASCNGNTPTTASPTTQPTTEPTTQPTTEPTTESTTVTTQSTTPAFPCVPGVTDRYPFPGDCTKFYNCQANGNYDIAKCPSGKWFVPELKFCEGPPNYPPPAGCSI